MDRLTYRSVKSFLDFLVTKFGLPTKVKLEACLVLQSQDRVISDLSQIFKNDYVVIMQDPMFNTASSPLVVKNEV